MDSKKSGIPLFRLFGFEVRLDWSWFFLAILVTWTLAVGYFPIHTPKLTSNTYWMMGLFGTIGLFISIVFHELSHSLVGRYYGVPIAGITLFIFGGIAQMSEAPLNPKSEFYMSLAGPLFSFGLAIVFYLLFHIGTLLSWPVEINGVLEYLSTINLILGIFNLLPGFPLDGGRVFRAILWWWKGNLNWATEIACRGGIGLGFGLIFMGIFEFVLGSFIAGIWSVMLGFFLQNLSKMSYQEVIISDIFRGESIKKYTKTNVVTISPKISLQELIDNYFYKYYHKLYPVVENGKLIGCISFNEIKTADKNKWSILQVKDIMRKCTPEVTMDVTVGVTKALQLMTSLRNSRFIVTDHNELYGIITLKDITDVISIRSNLEMKE